LTNGIAGLHAAPMTSRIAIGMVCALLVCALDSAALAQSQSGTNGPVVFCRDPARNIVARVLASDCPAGNVVSEKEAEASRNAASERRRRLLLGERPDESKPQEEKAQEATAPAESPPPPAVAAPPAAPPAAAPKQQPAEAKPAPRPATPAPAAQAAPPATKPAEAPPQAAPAQAAPAQAAAEPEPPPEPVAPPPAALAEVVAIVKAMKPGEFRAVSKNTLESVKPNLQCGGTGIFAVMNAWGGGTFDTKRHRLMITGGGHADYCGNEVYVFDLATLSWIRETDPAKVEKDEALTAANPNMPHGFWKITDGSESPLSFHSYDVLQYLPNVDRMFAWPQASWMSGWSYDSFAYLYDSNGKRWKRGAKAPTATVSSGCDYWARNGEVICSSSGGVIGYKPETNAWRVISNGDDAAAGRTAVIDPGRALFVQLGRQNPYNPGVAPLVYYDLKQGAPRRTIPNVTGNTDFIAMSLGSGIAWHPPTKRFAIWAGANEVWAVDQNWNSVRYEAPTGPRPPTWYHPGIYGKWQYVPSLDIFIGARSTKEPVWLYKLPRPGEVAGDSTATASVRLQATVDALLDGGTARFAAGKYRQSLSLKKSVTIDGNGATLSFIATENKGAIVVSADNVTLKNLTVTDISGGENLAAVRLQAPSLTIDGMRTERVQTALLSAAGSGTVVMRNSAILDTLGAVGEYGKTHAIYVGCLYDYNINKYKTCHQRHETINTVIRRVDSGGHTFKSRAASGLIDHSILAQEGHDGSRSIDLSNGGDWVIRCTVIQHGNGGNSDIIGFGREGDIGDGRKHALLIDSSVIINDRKDGPGQLAMRSIATPVIKNSIVVGVALSDAQDGGGNKLFASRAAAGLAAYPAAEMSMLPQSCRR
jgi:hypothetical protein